MPTSVMPRLTEVVSGARTLAEALLALLRRDVDPASVPDTEVWPGMTLATSDTRSVLEWLHDLAALPQPPTPVGVRCARCGGRVQVLSVERLCETCIEQVDRDHPNDPPGGGPHFGPVATIRGVAAPCAGGPPAPGAGDSFTLPPTLDAPAFPPSRCPGKSRLDGRAAECGYRTPHEPHRLDRPVRAL